MDSTKKPKPDDPAQSKRFLEAAKEVGADDEKALDRALKKATTRPPKTARYKAGDE